MSARLARTADGWWLVTAAGLIRLDLTAATTARLLADRAVLTQAISAARDAVATAPRQAVPAESLELLSPVTTPARVVAQMVNYRSHALDSGMAPDRVGSPRPSSGRRRTHSQVRAATSSGPKGSVSWTTKSSLAWSSGPTCRSGPR